MLVLSRKPGQAIDIDGPCRVTVIRVAGDKVRIGFEADRGVKILRSELDDELFQRNQANEGT